MEEYLTIDLQKSLTFILDCAYEKKISTKNLCEGIYDYSSFINIINKKKNITLRLIVLLAEKIELPLSIVFTFSSYKEYLTYIKYERKIDRMKAKKDYSNINEIKNELYIAKDTSVLLTQLYICVEASTIILYDDINKYKEHLEIELLSAIKLTNKNFTIENFNKKWLTYTEKEILAVLINLYLHTKNYKKAKNLIDKLIENQEFYDSYSKLRIFSLKILYEYELSNYSNVIIYGEQILNEALDFLYLGYISTILEPLYESYIKMGDYKKSKNLEKIKNAIDILLEYEV